MIVVDVQAVQSLAHGERGIARFVAEVARSLAAEHPGLVDAFAWNDLLPRGPKLDELGLGDRLRPFSELRGATVDVLHVGSPFEGLRIGDFWPPVRARRVVATCYDLIPYRFPAEYLANPLARARYRNRLAMLTAADALVTDSQSAADDAHELLGVDRARLTVIGAGVGRGFEPATDPLDERLAALASEIPGIRPRFVLVPTGMDWRKNTMAAIEAYAGLPAPVRDRHQLVLSCRVDEHHRAEIDAHCERLGVGGRILVTDYVSDATLVRLYQTAELVYFPSVYEGFGLPVLEARRCGARVICANTSSLPEVLPEPEAWFNPYDVAEMTALLERALTDAAFAARLDAIPDPGFGWSEATRRLAGVYRAQLDALVRDGSVTESTSPSVSPARRRLGVVSPLPPTRNGVANHTSRLLTAIAGCGDDGGDFDDVAVTAFVPWGASGLADEVGYPVRDLSTLPAAWAAGELDAVLYCVGNHEVHRGVLSMMELVPGHLFVHDARLLGAVGPSQWRRLAAEGVIGEGSRCLDPFVRRAISVLVQSAYAAELVAAETGADAVDVGPHHVPAVDVVDAVDRRDVDSDAGDGPWVVTAGVADRTKRTDLFVAAAHRLPEGVRAAVVGPLGDRFVDPDDPVVTATGRVPDPELDVWLRRADVVVALRDRTNGESSGIVADALARGRAVVVSDVGAMSELPDDAVVKVPATIDADALAGEIAALLGDADRRSELGTAALRYAAAQGPDVQARRLVDAVFDAVFGQR